MEKFYFERECRTANSECYTVLSDDDSAVGRIDIHFADTVVHATLNVAERLTTEEIQDLIDTIDEQLMDPVGITRQEVIVHVHQGRDLGVFSTRNFEGNGGHVDARGVVIRPTRSPRCAPARTRGSTCDSRPSKAE